MFWEGSNTTTSSEWISLFWLIIPQKPFLEAAFSSFSQCSVGVSSLNQYWAIGISRVGFDGSSRVDLEFSLGRAQKMTEMHPEGLSASPLLHSAPVRKVSVEQLFCSTPGVFSFHGRSRELQAQTPGWFVKQFRTPPNKGSSQLLPARREFKFNWENFCILEQAGLAPPQDFTSQATQRLLCLPLFNYVVICVYNVHTEFILLWINFHTYIRKLLSEYKTQQWDLILMPFSQFYELDCKSGEKEMNYSLSSKYLLHRSLCFILHQ